MPQSPHHAWHHPRHPRATTRGSQVGLIPVAIAAYCQGEFQRLPLVAATLTPMETGCHLRTRTEGVGMGRQVHTLKLNSG